MNRRPTALLLTAALALAAADAGAAETLRIGWKIDRETFAEAWGVDPEQNHTAFGENGAMRVKLIASNVPANILWPGDRAKLTFQFENLTDKPLELGGAFVVQRYRAYDAELASGRRGLGRTGLEMLGKPRRMPLKVALPAEGFRHVTVEPGIGATFGGYVVLVDVAGQGRFFGAGLARVRKNVFPRTLYRRFTMDAHSVDQMARLAAYPNRTGMNWRPVTDEGFEEWYATNRRMQPLKAYREAGMTVTVEFGHCIAPTGERSPIGRVRPHLDANDVMRNTKSDYAWMPQYDKDFEEFVYRLCCDYGYPKGPINGVMLWNEPWEGMSISGWGADLLRYREIYKAMARAVERARKDAGVDVLIGGCDSSSNTFDKLFPDGDAWLKWLDFMSIHYQGNNPRSTVRKFLDRKHYKGRVLVWDTESWAANTDDGVAAMVAGCASFGYDRIVGIYGGGTINKLRVEVRQPDGKIEKREVPHAWPINADIAASQSFVGERAFRELLFRDGLPWVMVFDGLPDNEGKVNPEDGTVVVVGDLPQAFRGSVTSFPLRSVRSLAELDRETELRKQLDALPADAPAEKRRELRDAIDAYEPFRRAVLTMADGGGTFRLYAGPGNRIRAEDGRFRIPLDMQGYYLRTDGSGGSFARLLAAVRSARIEGLEPLATVCRDMTRPVDARPRARLKLTNVLNREISGTLKVTLGKLDIDAPGTLRFKPHETKIVPVEVVGGEPSPDNTYPLSLAFDAGKDGRAVHTEDLHVNEISRRTVRVDGKLEDWKGALPQPIRPPGQVTATLEEVAWHPYAKLPDAVASGFATAWLAHDDKHFYFAARIADDTPHAGMVRFETRDDDAYYYPEKSIEYDRSRTVMMVETASSADHDEGLLQHPTKAGKRAKRQWSYEGPAVAFAIDLDLPEDRPRQVSLFVPPWRGGSHSVNIEIYDRRTDRRIGRKRCPGAQAYHGQYVRFNAVGEIRVKLTGPSWLNAGVAGVFFDAPATNNAGKHEKLGRILDIDYETAGNWKGVYGKHGWQVVGAGAKLPEGVKLAIPREVHRKEYIWPDGVRRYSYRKQPDLPNGHGPVGGDNVQIAFNAIPPGDPEAGQWYSEAFPKGTRWQYTGYACTDYEYALNPVAERFGGGTEIWRMRCPNLPPKHFYPRQPTHKLEGPVSSGKLVVRREGNTRIVECAIPWSEVPHVKTLRDAGKRVKFSCRINDDAGRGCVELARGRSVSKRGYAFLVDWQEHWANEVEFAFEK